MITVPRPIALPCSLPYRIDIASPPPDALDLLIQLGALDVDPIPGGLAAILPDAVTADTVAHTFGFESVTISPAVSHDDQSVWLLSPRSLRIGRTLIVPPEIDAPPGALRLIDSTAFGTGHHPTTALCIEALEAILAGNPIPSILDVGTGSGILALIALNMGVPRAVGLDVDAAALEAAAENARLNHLAHRLQLVHGAAGSVTGCWPLVVANVLAAPLIEMAPLLAQRVASRGQLLLSGIPLSVESQVRRAYEHLGMKHVDSTQRDGWVMLDVRASW